MGKPGKYPWNDEDQEFRLFETLENGLKLSVLGHNKIENDFAQDDTYVADVEFKKVVEVDFACFFHHVVSNVISKNGQKDRGDIMKALNVPEFRVVSKEIVQDHEDIILSLFSS